MSALRYPTDGIDRLYVALARTVPQGIEPLCQCSFGALGRIQTCKRSLPSDFKSPAFVSFATSAYCRLCPIHHSPTRMHMTQPDYTQYSIRVYICGPCHLTGTVNSNPYHGVPPNVNDGCGPGPAPLMCAPSGPLVIVA